MSKKLIVTISSIVAVALIVLLICLLFIVGDIKVLTTSELLLNDEEKASIIEDSKIVKHSSIFSLSEEIATKNIEKENPMLKVVKIERKIPNKVVINVSSRVGILAIPHQEGGYWIVDRELKILERVNSIDDSFYAVTTGLELPENAEEGMFIEGNDWMRGIIAGLEFHSFAGKRFGTFITSISTQKHEDKLQTITLVTNTGVKFIVPYLKSDLITKVVKNQYICYLDLNEQQRSTGSIILDDNIHYVA